MTLSASHRTRVKICGLRRPEDIDVAIEAGADSIGLVFCARSPRHLEPDLAAELVRRIPAFVSVVALFLDPQHSLVERVLQQVQPELLQFHGKEPAAFCTAFGRRYLKAVSMLDVDGDPLSEQRKAHPQACGFVLDSHAVGGIGGTGQRFDWNRVQDASRGLVLAGGLDADNVAEAITQLRPWAVDVSSGVEDAPGVKSAVKLRAFLNAVREADDRARAQNR